MLTFLAIRFAGDEFLSAFVYLKKSFCFLFLARLLGVELCGKVFFAHHTGSPASGWLCLLSGAAASSWSPRPPPARSVLARHWLRLEGGRDSATASQLCCRSLLGFVPGDWVSLLAFSDFLYLVVFTMPDIVNLHFGVLGVLDCKLVWVSSSRL